MRYLLTITDPTGQKPEVLSHFTSTLAICDYLALRGREVKSETIDANIEFTGMWILNAGHAVYVVRIDKTMPYTNPETLAAIQYYDGPGAIYNRFGAIESVKKIKAIAGHVVDGSAAYDVWPDAADRFKNKEKINREVFIQYFVNKYANIPTDLTHYELLIIDKHSNEKLITTVENIEDARHWYNEHTARGNIMPENLARVLAEHGTCTNTAKSALGGPAASVQIRCRRPKPDKTTPAMVEVDSTNQTPTPKEKTPMKSLALNTITYLNGADVSRMTDDELVDHIRSGENELADMDKIVNKPKKLQAKMDKLTADIQILVEYIDHRETK